MARILVVENERIVARDLCEILGMLGHVAEGFVTNYEDALGEVNQREIDLVLVDIGLAGLRDGIALALALREEHDVAIAFITSHDDSETVGMAAAVRPNGYLIKPYSEKSVDALVRTALANYAPDQRGIDYGGLTEARALKARRLTDAQLAAVEQHVARKLDSPIAIQDLADLCALSEATFSRLFAASTGVTPYNYIVDQRMAEAKRLLRHSEWSIAEVAIAAGFGHQAHFTTMFRRRSGTTPAAYRRLSANG